MATSINLCLSYQDVGMDQDGEVDSKQLRRQVGRWMGVMQHDPKKKTKIIKVVVYSGNPKKPQLMLKYDN